MAYILPQTIKNKIGETLGIPILYPGDCERLAIDIRVRLNETIGVTTIKRLMGFASDVAEPRKSTLDLLARYAGYDCYDSMTRDLCPEGDSDFEKKPDIDPVDLNRGDKVVFSYLPDRKVELEYLGDNNFKVTSSENGSLCKGDIVTVSCFNLNRPLKISNVERDGESLGRYVAGKVSGLISLGTVEA